MVKEVTMSSLNLTSVTLNKNALALVVNGTETLTATVNGENNPSQAVNWTTSNSNIATVSSSGLVTGKATGSATITATSALDNTKSASCTVTVSAAPSSQTLTITRSSFAVAGGYAWYTWTENTSASDSISGKAELYTTETGSMQFNKSKGDKVAAIYNTTAIPGSITKIEATSEKTTIRSWTAYVTSTACSASGATLTFGSNKTTVGSASPAVGTSTSFGTSSAGYSYFCIQENDSSASYISEFKITYTPSSTKTLTSIELSNKTTSFVEGDTFAKATVTAHYSDNSAADVTNSATFTGYDMTSVSEQTVTVTYGGKSATYTITVSAGTLTSIALSGQTTAYSKNATFSFDGTCTATFANGYQKVVEPTSVSSPDMSTGGQKEVTVGVTYNGVTKTASYNITVNAYRTVIETSTLEGTITWPTSSTASISGNVTGLSASLSGKTVYESTSIRLGTGNGGGTLTISSTAAIKSVKISAKYYSGSYSSSVLKVDGQSVTPLSASYDDYTVTLSSAKTSFTVLTENSSNRINIQRIDVYADGPETDIGQSADCVGLETFINTYLHMDDYTESKGWCKDTEHNYYGKNTSTGAKAAFNALNAHQRELFTTNSAYASEWARLSAWAEANGDSLKATNILGAYRYTDVVTYSCDNTGVILIGVLVAITFIGVSSSIVLIKKRGED